MDNNRIADHFSLLAKLMDIHSENSFRAKSYASAAFTIEKLPVQLSTLSEEKIIGLRGIGEAMGKKIMELLSTQELEMLQEYIQKTPEGILQMMNIKGLGPKKIATIWKELEIESLGELLYACNENRLCLYKGFGEKTQNNIKASIEFYFNNLGSYLYQQVESFEKAFSQKLSNTFPNETFLITGEYRRQLEIIQQLDWVTTLNTNELINFFTAINYQLITHSDNYLSFKGTENLLLGFFICSQTEISKTLFQTSASPEFLEQWKQEFPSVLEATLLSNSGPTDAQEPESSIFEAASLPFIPAYLRESPSIIHQARQGKMPQPIQTHEIRGIIHSHSQWSDGQHSLEEMAQSAKEQGFEYLVISDHSKSAFYANGLSVERIEAQQKQIEELNRQLAPFTIFKSIESDILNDGNLDYEPSVLASFDLVIASVHSNLKMLEEKAMTRLLKAIENPFTSILGHLTGRLLLSRNGYPINHEMIIDACAANQVVIELNAHPRRLDIDWRWIDKALAKNVLISINPDAHSVDGFKDCQYGILVAQKAGLEKSQNLSSYSLAMMKNFIQQQHLKRP